VELRVAIEHDPSFRGTSVYIYGVEPNGTTVLVEPMELHLRTITEGERIERPTLQFKGSSGEAFLQSLATALVAAGYRPEALTAKEGVIDAMASHIKDLRRMAFGNIKEDE
jgi:hypothetical protein